MLKDLRNASDPVVNVVIVTREELRAPLRQIICEHFGLDPSGDCIEISPFRRVHVKNFYQNMRGFGGRVVLFHPDVYDGAMICPMLYAGANHSLFIEDRVVRDVRKIAEEMSALPRVPRKVPIGAPAMFAPPVPCSAKA